MSPDVYLIIYRLHLFLEPTIKLITEVFDLQK